MPSLRIYLCILSLYGSSLQLTLAQNTSAESLCIAAHTAYEKEQYSAALAHYEACLSYGQSAQLYFNLQEVYLKEGLMGKALLAYERLRLLAPYSELRALAFEKIKAYPRAPRLSFAQALASSLPSKLWTGLFSLALGCILAAFTLPFVRTVPSKCLYSLGATGAILGLLLVVASWGWYSYQKTGLILQNTPLKLAPTAQSPHLAELSLGEWVRIDKATETYTFVITQDQHKGWILKSDIEALIPPVSP